MILNLVLISSFLQYTFAQTTPNFVIKDLCQVNCIGNKFCEKTCEVNDEKGVYSKVGKCEAGSGFINRFNCTGKLVGLEDYQTAFWITVYGKQVECQKDFDENTKSCATNCTGKVESGNDVLDCTKKCAELKKPSLVTCFIGMTYGSVNSTRDYASYDRCQSKCKDPEGDNWKDLFNCNLDCMEPLYKAWELDVGAARGEERPSGNKKDSSNKGSFAEIISFNGLALTSTLLLTLLSTL